MSEEAKKRIGDYEILDELGAGGMGKVYRVRNVISDRIEALKILLPDLAGRQELADRFLREIKVLASLDHPNIAALRTAFLLDNQLVMVMEYLKGQTLSQKLDHGPMAVGDALKYIDQVLEALSYAHGRKVIHRDIKPSNMMLMPDGTVKLMDFGIAYANNEHSLTTTGTTLGSLDYMSPEQVKGEPTDARSDIYSVGVSLYEMVTGQRPFKADSDYSIMAAHVKEVPKPPIELRPDMPVALNDIILLALAKEPGHRFQSADALRNALRGVTSARAAAGAAGQEATASAGARVAEGGPTMAPPPPAARPGGYRGLYMTLGALLVIAVLVAAGVYYKSRAEVTPPGEKAAIGAASGQDEAKGTAKTEPEAGKDAAGNAGTVKGGAEKQEAGSGRVVPQVDERAAAERAAAEAELARQLEGLEQEVDQLTSRAVAVDNTLTTMRAQQRAAGYDLRGDIVGKQESMKVNLQRAREALESRDAVKAKKHVELTNTALGQLEKFLGR